MPQSPACFFHPKDHGSLEDITLHPQLRVLRLKMNETGPLINGEALDLAPLDPFLLHPIPQRSRVQPQIVRDASDWFARLQDNPNRPLTNSGSYFLRSSDMTSPHSGSLHTLRGCPAETSAASANCSDSASTAPCATQRHSTTPTRSPIARHGALTASGGTDRSEGSEPSPEPPLGIAGSRMGPMLLRRRDYRAPR